MRKNKMAYTTSNGRICRFHGRCADGGIVRHRYCDSGEGRFMIQFYFSQIIFSISLDSQLSFLLSLAFSHFLSLSSQLSFSLPLPQQVWCGLKSGNILRIHAKSRVFLAIETLHSKAHTGILSGVFLVKGDPSCDVRDAIYVTSMDASISVNCSKSKLTYVLTVIF